MTTPVRRSAEPADSSVAFDGSNAPLVRDRVTWLTYAMLAYFAFYEAVLGPSMPFLREELRLSYTVAGLHMSAFALGMMLAGLFGERVATRWGRRVSFWLGSVGLAVGAMGLAVGGRAALTVMTAFCMGLFGTLLLATIQAVLSDHYGEQRATALTEANIGASLGAGLAPLAVGTFQRVGIGWRGAWFLGLIALVFIAVPLSRIPLPQPHGESDGTARGARSLPTTFWVYWIVICLGVAIEWCIVFWAADFMEGVAGLSKSSAATALTVFFVAAVLGRIAASRLTRRMPTPRLVLLAFVVSLFGFPVFWLAAFPLVRLVGLFVAGFGVGNFYPLTMSLAIGSASDRADAASARVSLGVGLAIFVAPLVLGWAADRIAIQSAFGIVATLLVIATTVVAVSNRRLTGQMAPRSAIED